MSSAPQLGKESKVTRATAEVERLVDRKEERVEPGITMVSGVPISPTLPGLADLEQPCEQPSFAAGRSTDVEPRGPFRYADERAVEVDRTVTLDTIVSTGG